MNDATLIAMALISTLGMLAGIQLMNHNWFKRQKELHKYKVKTTKLRQKGAKIKSSPPSSPLDWVDKIRGLDPDLLHTLIDTLGGEEGGFEPGGDIMDYVIDIGRKNPDLVKGFLEGVGKIKGENQEDQTIYNK